MTYDRGGGETLPPFSSPVGGMVEQGGSYVVHRIPF